MNKKIPFLVTIFSLLSVGVLVAMDVPEQQKPSVLMVKPQNIVVSLKPYALLIESFKQAGDQVSVLVEDGASAHDFLLQPSHIKKIAEADWVIWSGEAAEPTLAKALKHKKQQLKLLEISELELIHLEAEHQEKNHHNHHANVDSHIWFSQKNALHIATSIASALNYSEASINNITQTFTQLQADANHTQVNKNSALIVYHNAYAYLEQELNIKHEFVINENHNTKPSLRHWHGLKEKLESYARQNKPLCIVTMAGFENSSEAKQLKQLLSNSNMTKHTNIVEIDPLASSDHYQNYFEFFLDSKKRLLACLSEK